MKTLITTLMMALAVAAPAAAQSDPSVSLRAFGLLAEQRFSAHQTFDATVGSSTGTFVGGGLELLDSRGWFLDLGVSHYSKHGQRVFVSDSQTFPLGINLSVSMTPIDVLLGYGVRLGRSKRLRPYAAIGVTSLGYKETSDFSDATDNVDTRKAGPMFAGGLEVHVASLVSVSADVAASRVTGILGSGGASAQFGEDNAGGAAVRFRVIVGR